MTDGGCLCGAVRYRVDGPLGQAGACHCTECRRASGHFIAGVSVARDALTVEGAVSWFESTPGAIRRGFCPVCGANLFWERLGDPTVDIWCGSVDGPTGITLTSHIFVAEKGDYYEITDDLPQYPAGRP